MYRPLPKYLTINKSSIDGLGLFATEDIAKGVELGITHVYNERFENNYIRTPLGGFINHSNDPNVDLAVIGDVMRLYTIKPIKKGEELLTKYKLYGIT
jgi:SET domain-containing protein